MTNESTTQKPTIITFAVEGMSCHSCVRHVGEALKEHFELVDHQVDLVEKKLTVSYHEGTASPEAIASVMNEAGYPVTQL